MNVDNRAGSLRFTALERTFGDDGGPDIRVYGPMGGKERQLLRFDCFRGSPHYHLDPDGRDEYHAMTPEQAADSQGWTLGELESNLAAWLRNAGADDIAIADAASDEARQAIARIASEVRATA